MTDTWQRFGTLAQKIVRDAAAKRAFAESGNDKLDRKIGFCLDMMAKDRNPKWVRRWVALSAIADLQFRG